jgi:RNA polymerase sigma-70 factor, ECF subfamily
MLVPWSREVPVDHASGVEPGAVTRPGPPASGIRNLASCNDSTSASKSFAELYQRQLAYVFTTARRLGVLPDDVDDIVQETFLTAHRRLDSYEPQGAERSWLFAILYRVVLHHRRSHRRRTALTEDGINLDVLPGPSATAPDKSAEARETVRLLEAILDTLDPEKRAVLVLAELEEKPVTEIAEILGLNLNTATSRLRLAREAVESALARHRARDGWRYK